MKRLPLLCLAAVLLLLVPSLLRAEDKPARLPLAEQDIEKSLRTDHYGVYLVGQKCGYGKITMARLDDPKNPGYVTSLEFLAKIVSTGVKSEMRFSQTFEFDAKPPYAMRRGVTIDTNGKMTREILVARTDKGFDVVISAAGEKITKQIKPLDYTLADQLTPNVWLRQGPKVGDTLTTVSFDFDELKLDREIRKLLATRTSTVDGVKVTYHEVEITLPKDGTTGLERYPQNADHLLSLKLAGVLELREEPEKQAKNVEYSQDLFALGSVKIDRPLGEAKKVSSLTFEVVAKEAPAIKPGPHQAVAKNDAGTLVVKLGKVHGTPMKATEKEIEESLAETTTYLIKHPKVQELAKEAVGDAKTPEEKVARIVEFVHKFIKPSYTAEPLTLLDLIKVRKGDCSEYALLFTALARASDVPTRELGGLVYTGDDEKSFGPHAWNEVVLDGHWVPVDASSNETDVNATHLSFGSKAGDMLAILASAGKLSFKLIEVKHKK